MKVQQISLTPLLWKDELKSITIQPDFCLLFISPGFKPKQELMNYLNEKFEGSMFVGCSTAGEILNDKVSDNTVSLTAVKLEKVRVHKEIVSIDDMRFSYKAGKEIASKFETDELKHLMIFSDGLNVNGADLVAGLKSVLTDVSITGGLAADGADFEKTFVIHDKTISDKKIVALGFYGDALNVGYSSKAGWDSFGIERLVTKSHKNVLYELDGEPALEIYKSFLGEEAQNLPSSGLLFPLSMRDNETADPLVRTILAVDEETQSLTFAGNIQQGAYVRLMKANIDRLIDGAEDSAHEANKLVKESPDLAILISCVGRRLVLKQLVEEEVEAVKDIVGTNTNITGFYSYGEIAPSGEFSPCELHNQTMTITTLKEC